MNLQDHKSAKSDVSDKKINRKYDNDKQKSAKSDVSDKEIKRKENQYNQFYNINILTRILSNIIEFENKITNRIMNNGPIDPKYLNINSKIKGDIIPPILVIIFAAEDPIVLIFV